MSFLKNTPNKEIKTSTDLHQGQQIKKKERHTQSLGKGPMLFSLPENRKTVKKVNQKFFKDGVVRQKSAHKNFIKKVVVWGFLSVMREKRGSNGKKTMNKCVCACVCENTNVCKCVFAIWTFQAERVTAGRKNKTGTFDWANIDKVGGEAGLGQDPPPKKEKKKEKKIPSEKNYLNKANKRRQMQKEYFWSPQLSSEELNTSH